MASEILEQFEKLRLELKKDMKENSLKIVTEIKECIGNIDKKIKTIEDKISYFDREIRKRNIVIFGVTENSSSYWELEKQVCDILNEKLKLKIDLTEIDFVRRIGKKVENIDRPILVGFISFRLKLSVMQNTYKLKGSKLFIAQDFSKEVMEVRKNLQSQLILARQAGNFAVLRYDKLIIKEGLSSKSNKKRLISSPGSPSHQENARSVKTPAKKNKFELRTESRPNSVQVRARIEPGTSTDSEKSIPKGENSKSGF